MKVISNLLGLLLCITAFIQVSNCKISFGEFNGIKNSLVGLASSVTGASDCISVGGCNYCYTVKGQLMGYKWKYVGVCSDSCSGAKGRSVTKSQSGAVEHCLNDLFSKM